MADTDDLIDRLFARHVATCLANQLAFADLVGEQPWSVDLGSGICTFGPQHRYPLQLLATVAEASNSWLWAWANPSPDIRPELTESSRKLHANAGRDGFGWLGEPEIDLAAVPEFTLLCVSCGLLGGATFYRGPYDGGALLFLPQGVPKRPLDEERIITVLSEVISNFPLDHLSVVKGLMRDQGFELRKRDDTVIAKAADGRALELSFDPQGRITNMSATIDGDARASRATTDGATTPPPPRPKPRTTRRRRRRG